MNAICDRKFEAISSHQIHKESFDHALSDKEDHVEAKPSSIQVWEPGLTNE